MAKLDVAIAPNSVSGESAELEELAAWLGLTRVARADYTDHLTVL